MTLVIPSFMMHDMLIGSVLGWHIRLANLQALFPHWSPEWSKEMDGNVSCALTQHITRSLHFTACQLGSLKFAVWIDTTVEGHRRHCDSGILDAVATETLMEAGGCLGGN